MINKQGILNEGLDGDVGFFLRSGTDQGELFTFVEAQRVSLVWWRTGFHSYD